MRRTAIALAAVLMLPTACGSSGEDQARRVVVEFFGAVNAGDAARVCGLLAQRSREGLPRDCEQVAIGELKATAPPRVPVVRDLDVDGAKATAVVRDRRGGPEETVRLSRENGDWKVAAVNLPAR